MRTNAIPLLGLAHLSALEVPPTDVVTLAGRIGYGYGYGAVVLRLPSTPGGVNCELPLGSVGLRDVRARLLGEGLSVHDIEFIVLDQGLDRARLAGLLETAGELGATRMSVCGDDPERGRSAANFAALCKQADCFELGVDLEGMVLGRVANLSDAAAIVVAARRVNGGALVDALHLCRAGSGPRDVTAIDQRLIKSVQLCDAPLAGPATHEAIIAEARDGRRPRGEANCRCASWWLPCLLGRYSRLRCQ
jgi:sugar phosphate isomerase/epimerase